jgi:hypothetical protein
VVYSLALEPWGHRHATKLGQTKTGERLPVNQQRPPAKELRHALSLARMELSTLTAAERVICANAVYECFYKSGFICLRLIQSCRTRFRFGTPSHQYEAKRCKES